VEEVVLADLSFILKKRTGELLNRKILKGLSRQDWI